MIDNGSGQASQTADAIITGVAPTITPAGNATTSVGANTTFALATFTDPGFTSATAGTAETFTATVNWGDGSADEIISGLTVTDGSPGVLTIGSISAQHIYAAAGVFTVAVTITDDDDQSASTTLTIEATTDDPTGACLPDIDFDHGISGNILPAGTVVTDQWSLWGVNVTTNDPVNHPAMIFDSSSPTGGDHDLGTPHTDFGGPGVGSGGASGTAGQNADALGNVLIISEDADSSDPDDNASGGTLIFTFDNPVQLDEISLLDLDSNETSTITLFDLAGNTIDTVSVAGLGNNAAQTISLDADNVARMEIDLAASGAVTDLVFCRDLPSVQITGDANVDEASPYNAVLLSPDAAVTSWTVSTIADGNLVGTPVTIAGDAPTFNTLFADGDATVTLTGWATDGVNVYPATSLDVTVDNVIPTLTIAGDATVEALTPYTLDLSSTDPGDDTIIGWVIDWGDGTIEEIAGNPSSATHTYQSDGDYDIVAHAFDEDYDGPMVGLSTPIEITARGNEGVETFDLLIDDVVVASFVTTSSFQTFTFDASGAIAPNQIKIHFTNDFYDPANGIDNNLQVDSISIGSQTYQTEASDVWSTGTWKPADGVVAGYRDSEWLHSGGYFHFDHDANDGSVVEISALGNEGVETFDLLIGGTVVASYTTSTAFQTFTYNAANIVAADDVRIQFTNDLWDPANGIDNNLRVDFVSIDGQVFQTEDPSVYSTGTWKPADGTVAGFRESEWLHSGGYFQFAGGVSDSVAGTLNANGVFDTAWVSNIVPVTVTPSSSVWLPTVNFDVDPAGVPLSSGDRITDQFASLGFTVSTNNPNKPAMIFDSSHPTGGDSDLGTPNEHFGGPGWGGGGTSSNETALGNVLIISEDNDANDPDDNYNGGTLIFDFDQPVMIDELGIMDIDSSGNRVDLFDAAGNLIKSVDIAQVGNNGIGRVDLDALGVSRMEVVFTGSGAITDIEFCRDGAPIAAAQTRFYVVDRSDKAAYRYGTTGASLGDFDLSNSSPRGATTTGEGNPIWVIGSDKHVYVYDTDGETILGSWRAKGISSPEGIATDGVDIWIVDKSSDCLYRFAGAASRLSGSQWYSDGFQLAYGNHQPRGLTTDGTTIWTVDTGSDKVFAYDLDGNFVNWWNLDPQNSAPRGVTINPNGDDGIWVVDGSDDKVYHYANATLSHLGSQNAVSSFDLAPGNTKPEGIADPVDTLTLRVSTDDQIDVPGDVDDWIFNATAGQELYVDFTQLLSGPLTTTLLAPDGSVVDTTSGNFTGNHDNGPIPLTQTGTYTYRLAGNGTNTPDYRFTAWDIDPPELVSDISFNTPYSGDITTPYALDSYTFNSNAGDEIYFDVLSFSGGWISTKLIAPDGTTEFTNNSSSVITADEGPLTLDQTGEYTLEWRGFGNTQTPSYSFQINFVPPPEVNPIQIDEVYAGDIEATGSEDHWTFEGVPGQRIFVDTLSKSGGSLTTTLVAPDGSTVFSGTNFSVSQLDFGPFDITQTGTYSLQYSEPGGGTPDYSFRVWDVAPDRSFDLTLGEVVVDEIRTAGTLDDYTFEATAGTQIFLDMQQIWQPVGLSIEKLDVDLIAPDGTILSSVNDFVTQAHDVGPLELPQTGTYTLRMDGATDDIPGYQFRVDDVTPAVATPIAVNQVVSDAIDVGGRIHTYTIAATAGTNLNLDVLLNEEYPTDISGRRIGFTITSPSGVVVANNEADDTAFIVNETGLYTIVADDRGAAVRTTDNLGKFSFRIVADPIPAAPNAADLTVANVVADLVSTGDPATVNVSWTVTNNGVATASRWDGGAWTDQVIFSSEETVGELLAGTGLYERVFANVDAPNDLAPGESYTQSTTITLPDDFEGSFWVYVEADAQNKVYEASLASDNTTRSDSFSAVYQSDRPDPGGPAIELAPPDGSRYQTGTTLALSGSATSTNQSINAIFMIDVSTSTLDPNGLDINGDGVVDENDDFNNFPNIGDVLDAEVAAALRLTEQLQTISDDVRVASVIFAGGSEPLDAGPEAFNQHFVDAEVDTTYRDDESNFESAVTSVWSESLGFLAIQGAFKFRDMEVRQGTEFEPVMRDVERLIATAQPADRTLVYLLTDGVALDAAPVGVQGVADQGVEFYAFQIGGSTVTQELNDLTSAVDADPSSTGIAIPITDPTALTAGLLTTVDVQSVTVNGTPVDALDPAGNFFASVTLAEGANPFNVVATTAAGTTTETQITLYGDTVGPIFDFDDLLPAAGSVQAAFTGTTFNRAANQLHVEMAADNQSAEDITPPLVAVLENNATPSVSVHNAETMSESGDAAFVFDTEINNSLPVGTTSDTIAVTFDNPLRDRFCFEVSFLSTGNTAPAFTDVPVLTAQVDQPYSYTVGTVDNEGDTITIDLLQAPAGMTTSGNTLTWTPTASDIGHHNIAIEISDGRGGTANQEFTVLVPSGLANNAPLILSTPDRFTTVDEAFTYAITTADAEAQTVTLSLDTGAPAGAEISGGVLRWTPATGDIGDQSITILATDSEGAIGRQTFTLSVLAPNTPPVFTSTPIDVIAAGQRYFYAAVATDTDDAVSYSVDGPAEIMINTSNGVVSWPANLVVEGSYPITITATDARGLSATQPYTLTVQPDTDAPVVTIVLSDNAINIGDSIDVQVLARDNVAVTDIALVVDGVPTTLDADGRVTLTPAASGIPRLTATASDAAGNIGTTDEAFLVVDPSDVTPPTAIIESPNSNATIEYLTDVLGTVTDEVGLASYELEVSLVNTNQWKQIASASALESTTPIEITSDLIGVFDPTLLKNNQYDIRLTATDIAGNTANVLVRVSLDGRAKIGVNEQPVVDLTIPVAGGPPIMIHRQHSQLTADESGDFGNGWSFCAAEPDLRESVARTPFESLVGQFAAIPFSDGDKVYITTPDCQRVGFTFSPTPHTGIWTTLSDQYFDPRWIPDPGVDWRLYGESDFTKITSLSTGEFDLDGLPLPLLRLSNGEFIAAAVNTSYNPLGYELINKQGVRYSYDQEAGLESVVDRNGNTLEYTDDAITSSSGQQVQFQRDDQGRITAVIDPAGNQIDYTYDSTGDLIDVQYPNGLTSSYRYTAEHYLDAVNPENSVNDVAITTNFAYDVAGRLTASINANAEATQIAYNLIDGRQAVTDPSGGLRFVEHDERGNVTKDIDPVGDTTTASYDGNDNLVSLTNQEGGMTLFEYDSRRNMTSFTDPLGFETTISYDANNEITQVVDALGRSIEYAYDSQGNLTTLVDPDGAMSSLVYDSFGRVVSAVDAAGNSISFEFQAGEAGPTKMIDVDGSIVEFSYDAYGRPIQFVDQNGNVSQFARDAMGRIVSTTNALGQSATIEYSGRYPTKTTDHLGRSVEMIYDSTGQLIRSVDPNGEITQFAYDEKGQLTSREDALSRITSFQYNADGTVASITDAEGNVISYQYDGIKNLTAETDANGNDYVFEYDLRGDLVRETDPLGNSTSFTLDAVRRIVGITDARGATLQLTYDARNNVIAEQDANGNSVQMTYDIMGDLISMTDRNGFVTTYENDAKGRRTKQTDSLGNEFEFTFDDYGNTISATNPRGLVSNFGYDALNRMTSVTNPDGNTQSWNFGANGQVESYVDELNRTTQLEYDDLDRLIRSTNASGGVLLFEYDAVGNLLATTDELGRTTEYAYDPLNRRIESSDPAGNVTRWFFDTVGNTVRTVDQLGMETLMQYDDANRLISVTDPSNGISQYSYDKTGNLVSTLDEIGRETVRSYDLLGRLVTLTDDRGEMIEFEYDGHGNRTKVTDEAGNVTAFIYDALHRVKERRDPLGNSVHYQYDEAGNLTSVIDRLGRERSMAYDSLGRITEEQWIEDNAVVSTFAFSYDAVGNLLTAGGPNSSYTHAYDASDRLIQIDNLGTLGPSVSYLNSYDAVGNRTQVTDDSGVSISFSYDDRDLLSSIQWSGGLVDTARTDFEYDARGQRTKTTRYADLGAASLVGDTRYQFDPNGRTTLIAHHDAADVVLAQYDYAYDLADQLISESHHGETTTYSYDEIGQLLNADSVMRDDEQFAYDASGNRIGGSRVIGANNQLLSDDLFNYEYDLEGNLSSKTEVATNLVTNYEYDHRNRLTRVAVETQGGDLVSESQYSYDVFDRRIQVVQDLDGQGPASAVVQFTVYDGANAWADYDASGQVTAQYLFGDRPDEILARWRPSEGTSWYYTDRLGSVRDIGNSAGQIVNSISYSTFGSLLAESNPAFGDRFKFTGREYDQGTQEYYYRARHYDPSTGRFTSQDTIGFGGLDANLYRYVGNSPVNATDPTGNIAFAKFLIGASVGGSVGALSGYVAGAWCGYWEEWEAAVGDTRETGGSFTLFNLVRPEIKPAAWQRVHSKGLEGAKAGAIFGSIFGGAFSVALSPPIAAAAGVALGGSFGLFSMWAHSLKTEELMKEREEKPEKLFAHAMCMFGEVAIGELTGQVAGAAMGRAVKNIKPPSKPNANGNAGKTRRFNRTSEGEGQDIETGIIQKVKYKDLTSGAARLVQQLSKGPRVKVGNGVRVDDLRQASIYLNRELGVALDANGNLVVVRGVSKEVKFRPTDRPLVHTHPVFQTKDSHFTYDISVADDFVEAVVDWSGVVTHFNKAGIQTDPLSSPINDFGFIAR